MIKVLFKIIQTIDAEEIQLESFKKANSHHNQLIDSNCNNGELLARSHLCELHTVKEKNWRTIFSSFKSKNKTVS